MKMIKQHFTNAGVFNFMNAFEIKLYFYIFVTLYLLHIIVIEKMYVLLHM